MSYVILIHPSLAADLRGYAGDDPDELMCQAMLARGEIIELDPFVIKASPPEPDIMFRIPDDPPDQQAYLKFSGHFGRRRK